MIDPRVFEAASAFRKRFEPLTNELPIYALDGSWLSLNVVDAITFGVRGKKEFLPEEKQLVYEASCYLALMLAECWNSFEIKTAVELTEQGVLLRALEGQGISPENTHVVPIGIAYSHLLSLQPNRVGVVADFARAIGPQSNLTRLFAFGVAVGLSPFGSGPWRGAEVDAFKEPIEKVKRHLASQMASCYGRIFADEQLGQVAELYLGRVLYPPMLMEEGAPAVEAVRDVLRYLNDFGVSRQRQLVLLQNLILLGVEPLSHAAMALRAAMSQGEPAEELIAVFQAKEHDAALLRTTLGVAEILLGVEKDWIDEEQGWEERFEKECVLGFLPLVTLSLEWLQSRVHDKRKLSLIRFLASSNEVDAAALVKKLVAETPADLELRIQASFLDCVSNDWEKAEQGFRSILTEPRAEKNPKVYSHLATCLSMQQKHEKAFEFFEKSLSLPSRSAFHLSETISRYSTALALAGQWERVLSLLKERKYETAFHLHRVLTNQYLAHRELGHFNAALTKLSRLQGLSPFDLRVLTALTARGLRTP